MFGERRHAIVVLESIIAGLTWKAWCHVCVPGKIRVQIETQQFSRINSFNMANSGVNEWEVGC